jgi:hypothetical protein
MSNYLKTWEVLIDIEIFELFDLCKKGKLQAYNKDGDRVIDPDSCEKGRKDFVDFLHEVQMEEGGKILRNAAMRNQRTSPEDIEKILTSEEEQKEALKRYNDHPDIPIIPEGCVGFDFTVPTRPSYFPFFQSIQELRKQKIKEAEAFIFKKSDIEELKTEERLRFEKECGSDKPALKSKQLVDEFVRSITIYLEDDHTINIQIPGKKAEPFTASTLGFHKIGKEWDLLKKIIEEGYYFIGLTKTNEGNARRKRLKTVEEKLIKKLNENFNASIPSEYKLFEKSAKHEKGTWTPKFKIQPAEKYSGQTKKQILEKIKVEYSKDNPNQGTINELVVAAKEKGAGNDELKAIIPSKHKNEEVYDYKEGGHLINIP